MDKLKNLIKIAQVTGAADNDASFPVQQMTYNGKVVNALQIFPYGVYSNVSAGDSLGVMFSPDGNDSNKMALSYTPQKRPKDLEQNEISVYHPYTNSFIKFKNNGDLIIDSAQDEASGNIIVNCENVTVNANNDATVNANNNVVLNGSQIQNNGSQAGVVTTLSINPITGTPFPDGSETVRAGDG